MNTKNKNMSKSIAIIIAKPNTTIEYEWTRRIRLKQESLEHFVEAIVGILESLITQTHL